MESRRRERTGAAEARQTKKPQTSVAGSRELEISRTTRHSYANGIRLFVSKKADAENTRNEAKAKAQRGQTRGGHKEKKKKKKNCEERRASTARRYSAVGSRQTSTEERGPWRGEMTRCRAALASERRDAVASGGSRLRLQMASYALRRHEIAKSFAENKIY
ncbi:hypothetical protein V9T40_004790 [Parthenolecanium corni]|uniref:Uncharacterized protein n=1 Tax=Parthenolecanium corni TaxID=536013 RepID=A0AAN9TQX7_9HEMI